MTFVSLHKVFKAEVLFLFFSLVSFQIYCGNLLVWPGSLSQGAGEEMCQILRCGSSQDSLLLQQGEFLDIPLGERWPLEHWMKAWVCQTWRTVLTSNQFGSWIRQGEVLFLPVTLVWPMAESNVKRLMYDVKCMSFLPFLTTVWLYTWQVYCWDARKCNVEYEVVLMTGSQ